MQPAQLRLAFLAVLLFAAVLVSGYVVSSQFGLPTYGAWTGIQPLETKLVMLEDFARKGDVDALILGSSIADFGFNARLFSELMTTELGREYRAFNFATGGAEPRTLPKLYRLARSVMKPKNVVIIVPVEMRLSEELQPNSPDETLKNAPVSEVLDYPMLLSISRLFHSMPLSRNAPAIRDLGLYGSFRNLQNKIGMDAYWVDENGDRISYLINWNANDLEFLRKEFEKSVSLYPASKESGEALMRRKANHYFAERDVNALQELRRLVDSDGGTLYVFAHAAASNIKGGLGGNAQYRKVRRDFTETLGWLAGAAKSFDPVEVLSVSYHSVSDNTHLNTYGAEAYTLAAFSAFTGKSDMPINDEIRSPPDDLFPTKDPSFSQYAALIRRPAGEAHHLLYFRLVQTPAIPSIPPSDVMIAIRTPENKDIVTLASRFAQGEYVAEINLPPAGNPEGYLLRLVSGPKTDLRAMNNPVAEYEWVNAYPKLALSRAKPDGINVLALPPARNAGENLYLAFSSTKPIPPKVALKLVPQAPMQGQPLDLGTVEASTDGLIKVSVPTSVKDGSYAVEVRDVAHDTFLATSQPIETSARDEPVSLLVEGVPIIDGGVTIGWTGIRKPTTQDWIGIFPVGGKDDSRLVFQFTSGLQQGKMKLVFPPSMASQLEIGEYEARIYANGAWSLLQKTEPFRFVGSKAKGEGLPSAFDASVGVKGK
jgi:hypothetical protein